MSTCYPFRPVPGQRGPRGCGPVPAPPFDPQDYWATRKLVNSLFGTLETSKLDKADVVDPAAATEAGKAADAKKTQDELTRISGVASDAKTLAESKADKLSSRQLEAVNSGIDADKVAKIAQNETAISAEVSRATTEEARLQALINAIKTFDAVVADSLPSPSEQYSKKLYLVPSTNPETRNVKDEFICVKIEDVWGWEQVGSTAITIEFDNEPTEGSQKAARSGGIWSWVKSLLPRWLTSDYSEPATVASVNAKADRADSSGIVLANEIATLDNDGNPTRSGKTVDDFLPSEGDVSVDGSITSRSAINFIFFPRIGVNSSGVYPGIYVGSFSEIKIGSVEFPTGEESDLQDALDIKANSADIPGMVSETMSAEGISSSDINIGGPISGQTIRDQYGDLREAINGKVGSFASVGGASATVDNGVAKLGDFFTNSNSLLTGTIDEEIIEKGTAPDAHLEAPTDEHLKLVLADNSVAYDSAKALPYKLTSVIGDRVIATMTLTAASTDITLPTIAANDTTVKDFILDVTNAYAVEGVATDAGINIPRTDFKLVTRDGESLTDVTTVKAGKSAFLCFTQKSPVVVDGTTYPCWCVIQLPFGDPS